jgi:hypothetical protein
MMKDTLAIGLAASLILAGAGCGQPTDASITQDQLVRRTQELMGATAAGNQEPWKEIFRHRRDVLR